MKKIARNAILVVLALVISYLERFIPLQAFVPLPGIKLGLANIITIFILYFYDIPTAVIVLFVRIFLSSLLFGGITSFVFSLTGGLLALLIMAILIKLNIKPLTIYGISIAGAAFHNFGQILAAYAILQDIAVFGYLPFLLISSIVTGIITAVFSNLVLNRLSKPDLIKLLK